MKHLLSAGSWDLAASQRSSTWPVLPEHTRHPFGREISDTEQTAPEPPRRSQASDALWPGEHGEGVLSKASQRKQTGVMPVKDGRAAGKASGTGCRSDIYERRAGRRRIRWAEPQTTVSAKELSARPMGLCRKPAAEES